ncbi:MAG: CoA-binding protein [bacterium]|nr:CoA-binding protein [bacterium]MDD5756594.1 CoA-binding protein [bacterium]
MQKMISNFLKERNFAIVGSFKNETKVAYRIFNNLITRGYKVYPVNPTARKVAGKPCYKNISEIPFKIDVVNIVTPPSVTANIVKECRQKGINKVWLQPGAENQEIIEYCHNNNITVIHTVCVMLETLKEEKLFTRSHLKETRK